MKLQTTNTYVKVSEAVEAGYATISAQGGSRSGKTYNILIFLISYILRHPGLRLSIVRATMPAIKGSVWVDFKDILLRMGLYEERCLNKTDFVYHLPNGSWAEFFATADEQRLRGRKRHILFVNESNELTELEWQQLKMRTTMFSILDYNPSFTDEHWLSRLNRDERTYHFITTYKDNPFLEKNLIDEIESLKEKNPSLWQIYGQGMQALVEGLVFKHVDVVESIPDTVKRRWLGMDFGYTNDPTAIVEVGIQDDTLYLDEVCYRTEMLTPDIVRELKPYSGYKVISESADPRLVQEIYRAGINIHPVVKFKDSVTASIGKMMEYRICVTKRSINLRKEYNNYTYQQDKEGKWLNMPIDAFNHGIDAARYVLMNEVMGGNRRMSGLAGLAAAVR